MGILLGLGSTAFFGLQQALVRVGMRARPHDDGLFMSVLLNVALLSPLLLVIPLPAWDWTGIAGFVLAGLLTTWAGRRASFKAIRRVGPVRTSAFLMSAPVFAAAVGWVVLDETIGFTHGLGGAVILVGLTLLIRSRVVAESLVATEEPRTHPDDDRRAAWSGLSRLVRGHGSSRAGYAYALSSALLFGTGFVVRKWALLRYPNAVAGAVFGAAVALLAIVLSTGRRGDLSRLMDDNVRRIPWRFVAAGASSSVGLVMQFGAFFYLPAWIVSLLQGTQGLWMLVWSPLIVGTEERLTGQVVASVLLVAAGAGLIALRP